MDVTVGGASHSRLYFSAVFHFDSSRLVLPDQPSVETSVGGPAPFRITITPGALKPGGSVRTFDCTILIEEAVPADVQSALASPWHEQSEQIHQMMRAVNLRLSDCVRRVAGIIQWFTGNDNERSLAITRDRVSWSIEGTEWRPTAVAPPGAPQFLSFQIVSRLPAPYSKEKLTGLLEGAEVPLAHEMVREARGLLSSSPRSCIMLGVAAAEYGFKDFAASVVPAAEWLLMNMPSPPLDRLLHKYFPSLPLKAIWGVQPFFPKKLRGRIAAAVETRNRIAHAGDAPPDTKAVFEILQSVTDLLYILDAHSGHEWAWQLLSDNCKKEIKQDVEAIKETQSQQGGASQTP